MNARTRLAGYAAAAGLAASLTGGAPTASAAPATTAANTAWQTCNSKILQGSTRLTNFCVSWVNSTNSRGQQVVRPYGFEVDNFTTSTIYVTSEDIGSAYPNIGNQVVYTDTANHSIAAQSYVGYAPSSSGYWIEDIPTTASDGQAWVNVHLAISGHAYEIITVYDTAAL